MTPTTHLPIIAAIAGLLALSACTTMSGAPRTPAQPDQNPAHQMHYSSN